MPCGLYHCSADCEFLITSPRVLLRSTKRRRRRYLPIIISTTSLMSVEETVSEPPKPSLRYWSSKGTQIVQVESYLYKIHEPSLAKLNGLPIAEIGEHRCIQIPPAWEIRSQDFETLLEHLHRYVYPHYRSESRPECDQSSGTEHPAIVRGRNPSPCYIRSRSVGRGVCALVGSRTVRIDIPFHSNAKLQI